MIRPATRSIVLRGAVATTALTTITILTAGTAPAQSALPVGGTVASGKASIASNGATTTVTQASDRAIVNWQSFNVGTGKAVVFIQPTAQSATLNRVTGSTSSTIAGSITSNGAVYLVNPNGIAITGTGSVQTGGGFVASTLDIADKDFNAGSLNFAGTGASKGVSNAGRITAGSGTYVALLGGTVSDSGRISVPLGKVGLGSGERIVLDLNGDGFMQVAVPTSSVATGALVDVKGSIVAAGGRVELRAASVRDAVRNVVNVSGSINADSATGNGGTITLIAGGDTAHLAGTLTATGTLSARATGKAGNGGTVETSGERVNFAGLKVSTAAAHGKTGTWLLDPTDVTINANDAATISASLANNNVEIYTSSDQPTITGTTATGTQSSGNGDINVNSAINWSSANSLLLNAYNSVFLNAPINAPAGELDLHTGASTGGSTITQSAAAPITVASLSANSASGVQGSVNLTNSGNQFATLIASSSGGNFSLTDSIPFTLAGTLNTFSGGTLTLIDTGGGITATASNAIVNTAMLTGSTTGAATFTNAQNAIGNLGAFTNTGGAFSLTNSAALTIAGPLNVAGQTLTLAVTGTIAANAAVTANIFNLTSGNWVQNAVALPTFTVTDFRFNPATASFLRAVGGDGSTGNPFQIADAYGLQGIASGSLLTSNFTLANAIDASGTAKWNSNAGFVPIGTDGAGNVWNGSAFAAGGTTGFTGSLNGGGFALTGLTIARSGIVDTGLVGFASGAAALSNIALTNAAITGGPDTGALLAQSATGSTVSLTNDSVTGTVKGSTYTGGLVGLLATGSITNSSAAATVNGTSNVGGLAGTVGGSVGNSSATGQVTASAGYAGGLIGTTTSTATVTGSFATGTVSGTGTTLATNSAIGGLVGNENGGAITNSYATGAVQGGQYVGGLVGQQSVSGNYAATITGSHATGNVSFKTISGNLAIGGLVGYATLGVAKVSPNTSANVSIDTSYATGTVNNAASGTVSGSGGLVGKTSGYNASSPVSITNSYASGAVTGGGSAGGLVGLASNTTLGNVSASGVVSGVSFVGGLVGNTVATTITGAYATGQVSASNFYVGGLVGNLTNASTVLDAYATGAVNATGTGGYAGGLVGSTDGTGNTIFNAYASGAVSSKGTYTGGLVGYLIYYNSTDQIFNAYATGSVTGTSNVGGLVGVTDANARVSSTYASGLVSGTGSSIGGLIGTAAGTTTNSYWDSYSTNRTAGFGSGSSGSVTAVTSDPAMSASATYAFSAAPYYALTAASGIGKTTGTGSVTGFVFAPGNSTRPLLAFEVPVAGNPMQPTAASGTAPTIINAHQLQLVNGYATTYNATTYLGTTLAASYTLGGNINLAETGANKGTMATSGGIWSQAGFVSLGTNGAGLTWDGTSFKAIGSITSGIYGFSGTLNGAGDTLSNLAINRTGVSNTGLFGTLSGTVKNLTVGGTVTGGTNTGGVAGMMLGTGTVSPMIQNTASSVAVTGGQLVGGLVGNAAARATITGSSASGAVTGTNDVGGLVGYANRAAITGTASGTVNGRSYVGGLIGYQYLGTTTGSATGSVTGTTAVGGFVGVLDGGTATATSHNNNTSGPSTTDRNYGGVRNGGTAQSPQP